MLKNNNILKLLIIEVLLFIGWGAIVLCFADFDAAGFYFWGGFAFGILAFLASAASLIFLDMKRNRNLTEINYIPVYITIVYLFMAISMNSRYVFLVSGNNNFLMALLNVVLFIAFISVRIFTSNYSDRVEEQTEYVAEKIRPVYEVSNRLATVLGLAQDVEVRSELLKLKETVDYSSNISQNISINAEKHILTQLEQIQKMILDKKDSKEIIEKIKEAAVTWNTRNSMVSTIK